MIQLILALILLGLLAGAVWLRRRGTWPALPPRRRDRAGALPWYAARGRSGLAILALIGLIGLWLVLTNLGIFTSAAPLPSGEFVVRIAPLMSAGEDQRQGTIVAQQLLDALKARVTTPMNVGLINAPINSADEAQTLAQQNNVDVIIWGRVAEGATADQAALQPHLLWNPGEPYVPRTWQGYDGHFAIPADYDLAAQPLNGAAVLPPLLDGINHFSRGDADLAADTLDTLRRDYGDVLRPELPAMLRAIIYWAEGLLPDAEGQARDALDAASRPEHWNNLGALLIDQHALDQAHDALLQAVGGDPNLAPAHANLGRLFLDLGQPADSLPDLRSAVNLAPSSPPIVATLGEAYRRSGQLKDARTAADAVLTLDPGNGPTLAEQSMLALTPVNTATEELEWELELPQTRSLDDLTKLREQAAQGVAEIEALRNEYLRRANAYGADGRPAMQRLAETQAAILEQELLNRRYQLMLVQIEQGRVTPKRSTLRRLWDGIRGKRTPFQEAIVTAQAALKQEPSLPLQFEYHYQQGRAAYLSDNPKLARSEWDAAQKLTETAPETSTLKTRPDAGYGLAELLLADGKRDEARNALNQALEINQRYFPARRLLARMAEEDRRWADAEEQYRWLAEHRPWIEQNRLDLARVLREQNKLADAEEALLPLANANNVDALVMLGAMYRTMGKQEESAAVLQRALSSSPNSPAVHEELAELASARSQPQVAEAELRKALELDPQRSSAHIALGRLYAGPLGRPADAAEQFRAAVGNQSNDPAVHRQLGEVLLEIGNPQAAAESFKRAIELAPNSHEAHHGLATAYLAQGRFADAAKEEQRALDLANGNYTLAIVGMGDIEREQGHYEAAVKQYSTALERDPQLPVAYLGLGKTAMAQGQPTIAINHYRKGLEIAPNNVQLLLGEGDALLQQNDIDGARAAYAKVRELEPGNAAAHAGLGNALWKAGQTDQALTELEQAVRINPGDAETLLTIGKINEALDRPDAALAAYQKAAETRENWYEPRFQRGVLLLKLQRTEEAIKNLEAAIKLKDDFAQGHYWLGRAYRAAGRFADARSQFQRAITLQGDYYEARFFLGRTLDELGQAPDAVNTYTAILNDAPSNDPWRAEAQRELDRIR